MSNITGCVLYEVVARKDLETPTHPSSPSPPPPQPKTQTRSFTPARRPSPVKHKKVPSTFVKSPYKVKSQPTYSQPKAPSRRRIKEMCNPTNFTHLRTCEACRLKAIAANQIPTNFDFQRRSRSLSPTGSANKRDSSKKRSLSPNSTYRPVIPGFDPSPPPIPVYTPMRDILALEKVSRIPSVHRQGWVKAVLHWEKAVLRKIFDCWTALPAIHLVSTLNAVNQAEGKGANSGSCDTLVGHLQSLSPPSVVSLRAQAPSCRSDRSGGNVLQRLPCSSRRPPTCTPQLVFAIPHRVQA